MTRYIKVLKLWLVLTEPDDIGISKSDIKFQTTLHFPITQLILPISCSTSRQSLETIVEAIRHLEGDHLFNDIPSPPGHHRSQVLEEPIQEVPLALTTKHQTPQRLIKVSGSDDGAVLCYE